MIKLKPVMFGEDRSKLILNEYSKSVFEKMQVMYERNGFMNPWIGYFAMIDHEIVGSCGFKNNPHKDNTVEIAYTTAPTYQGKGYATEMCRILKNIALDHNEKIVLKAETLVTNFASHRILEKNRFVLLDQTVTDPKHGEIMLWEYSLSQPLA